MLFEGPGLLHFAEELTRAALFWCMLSGALLCSVLAFIGLLAAHRKSKSDSPGRKTLEKLLEFTQPDRLDQYLSEVFDRADSLDRDGELDLCADHSICLVHSLTHCTTPRYYRSLTHSR